MIYGVGHRRFGLSVSRIGIELVVRGVERRTGVERGIGILGLLTCLSPEMGLEVVSIDCRPLLLGLIGGPILRWVVETMGILGGLLEFDLPFLDGLIGLSMIGSPREVSPPPIFV